MAKWSDAGEWLEDRVKLPQYSKTFIETFGNSLSNIGSITPPTFEKGIVRMMGGDDTVNYKHLGEFTAAHKELYQSLNQQQFGKEEECVPLVIEKDRKELIIEAIENDEATKVHVPVTNEMKEYGIDILKVLKEKIGQDILFETIKGEQLITNYDFLSHCNQDFHLVALSVPKKGLKQMYYYLDTMKKDSKLIDGMECRSCQEKAIRIAALSILFILYVYLDPIKFGGSSFALFLIILIVSIVRLNISAMILSGISIIVPIFIVFLKNFKRLESLIDLILGSAAIIVLLDTLPHEMLLDWPCTALACYVIMQSYNRMKFFVWGSITCGMAIQLILVLASSEWWINLAVFIGVYVIFNIALYCGISIEKKVGQCKKSLDDASSEESEKTQMNENPIFYQPDHLTRNPIYSKASN